MKEKKLTEEKWLKVEKEEEKGWIKKQKKGLKGKGLNEEMEEGLKWKKG